MTGRGVGVCVGLSGAVVAVISPDPVRLAGIASVTWPDDLWHPGGTRTATTLTARRMLDRARRRLGIPRWQPVTVVIGPSLSQQAATNLLPRCAELLARAGLAQGLVFDQEQAAVLRRTVELVVDPRLGPAAAGDEAELATGAALAVLLSTTDTIELGIDTGEPMTENVSYGGWAVQRVDSGEPAGSATANLR